MSQRDGKDWMRDGMRAGKDSDLRVLTQVTSWLEAPLLRLREEQVADAEFSFGRTRECMTRAETGQRAGARQVWTDPL